MTRRENCGTKELCILPSRQKFGSKSKQDTPPGLASEKSHAKMNVAEGTVLARAKREGWTQQIAAAKKAIASTQSNAINRGSDARARRTLPRAHG